MTSIELRDFKLPVEWSDEMLGICPRFNELATCDLLYLRVHEIELQMA